LNFPDERAKGLDVYNPTIPFEYDGEQHLVGRVERRNDETDTLLAFFKRSEPGSSEWYRVHELPTFNRIQDPFISMIGGEVIIGGVRIEVSDAAEITGWETVFYSGSDLSSLELKFVGPKKMKDIRLVDLGGRIGVFTRPQGEKGGRGKVGYLVVDRLENLTTDMIDEAPLVPNLFNDEEWGGVNQALPLDEGKIGIIGHIARFDREDKRHYYPFQCVFIPEEMRVSEMKLLATKKDLFPHLPPKRDDLDNVLFPGGVFNDDGKTTLVSGAGDTSSVFVTVEDLTFADKIPKQIRLSAVVAGAGKWALSHST